MIALHGQPRGPVFIAAGTAGYAPDPVRLGLRRPNGDSRAGPEVGAFVTGALAATSFGGRPPQILETPAGALYVPGTARRGVREILRRHARSWAASPVPVIVNITGDSPEGFGAVAAHLEGVRGVAAIELWLPGPPVVPGAGRVEAGALRAAARAKAQETVARHAVTSADVIAMVAAVRRVCGLPVVVKLPAAADDLERLVRASAAAGAAAVTLGGGVPVLGGLLVGPATFPLVLDTVTRIAPQAALPLIAGGGVVTTAHARAYLDAGAAAIQVGAALFAHPHLAAEIAAAL